MDPVSVFDMSGGITCGVTIFSPTGQAPGSPWENGYIESFNGKLRDELLNREFFDTVLEARVLAESTRVSAAGTRGHLAASDSQCLKLKTTTHALVQQTGAGHRSDAHQ